MSMNTVLLFSLAATVLSAVVVGVYWCAIYPILRLKLRFSIHQVRDELRLEGISGNLPAESRLFLKIKKLANAAVSVSEHMSEFSSFPSHANSTQERFEVAALVEELEDAPKQLREIGRKVINRTFALYLSQRPFAFLGVAVLLVAGLASVSAKKTFERWLSRSIAETAIAAELQPAGA